MTYRILLPARMEGPHQGMAVNMSEEGLLFRAEGEPLDWRNDPIEVKISWPAQPAVDQGRVLWLWGHVVRQQDKDAAIRFRRYEFRQHGIVT